MTATRRAVTVAGVLLIVAAAVFLFLRGGSDAPRAVPTTTVSAAATAATVAGPEGPTPTTSAVTETTTAAVAEADDPADTSSAAPTTTATTVAGAVGTEPATPGAAAVVGEEPCEPGPGPVPMPEPVEWWTYNPALEWPVTDPEQLSAGDIYPNGMIEAAVEVSAKVEAFWAWYMVWGHPQCAALDLTLAEHREWLDGDAVGQLMYAHHRFWQQRLPTWQDVWNREFDQAREAQRNKLIYLDSLGELNRGAAAPTLLYNPADETTVWRYWGPIIRPVPDPTAPRRAGDLLPDDISGNCGPEPEGAVIHMSLSWECVHLGPAEDAPALGEWDVSWHWDIPHEHAAWYVDTADGLVRYDPDVHGAPTSNTTVADGRLVYLPATVTGWADFTEAMKPYRPEGFPDDPDAYSQMWRHDVGGNSSWHKEMGQLVLLVPAGELIAWLEANGYDPQDMFAQGWPNPDEEQLIRNTWAKDWDRDNPADWRNKFTDAVGWLEQGVELGDSGNLTADIEAAIHISAWMDWAYRARLDRSPFPISQLPWGWNPSVVAPGLTYLSSPQEMAEATYGHRPDGWATEGGIWWGLYHHALADGYHPDARTGRLTHPALNPELAVWKEWAAAGEAERWLGFQAADGDLGPAPGDTWIPWYPENMVPLENHYLLPEHAIAHWETVVDWWPDGGLDTPVHQPDWYHAFTVAGPYVAEAGGHLFETCLWATGGLFAAWSLPHPELEDASQNVTWIIRGIADREGRVISLAEPVNRPCIDGVNRWKHEGQIPRSGPGAHPTFESYLEWANSPIDYDWNDMGLRWEHDPTTGLWTTNLGIQVAIPSELFEDGTLSVNEWLWITSRATTAGNEGRRDGVLELSYEDWQQWETEELETARSEIERDLPLGHHRVTPTGWETQRQEWTDDLTDAFSDLAGSWLDTPARYGEWVLGGARAYPEGFMRSTYRIVSRHRQPGSMHWLYNAGTGPPDVDRWSMPESDWDRWATHREAGTLHTGVLITPFFVRHWETDRTITAGNVGTQIHSDWSWANVEMLDGYVAAEEVRNADGNIMDSAAPWTVYLTSCMEEGFPAFYSRNNWRFDIFSGFGPEAADSPVWAWPGVLTYGPDEPVREDVAPSGWPLWTWWNHPDIDLPRAFQSKLPPADCAGIAAGDYTPEYSHPFANAGNYPNWMSALGPRPPESWYVTESPFDE